MVKSSLAELQSGRAACTRSFWIDKCKRLKFIEGEGLLINLDMQGIAVSTGSACSSGSLEPSPVIRALGRNDELARGAIRFSFGQFNSIEDIEQTLDVLPKAVESLRNLSPNYLKQSY